MSDRIPRNAQYVYYATALDDRDGKTYGVDVGRFLTFDRAKTALNHDGRRGYVQMWSERTQSRSITANRDADGSWWSTNPYTGKRVEVTA